MRKIILFGAALAVAVAAHAEFEGVINMKITSPRGNGTLKVCVGPLGARNDMDVRSGDVGLKTTVLSLRAKPDVVYRINDERKAYGEQNLKETGEHSKEGVAGTGVQVVGQEKFAGYTCKRVVIVNAGVSSELWITPELMDYRLAAAVLGTQSGLHVEVAQKLKDAGADGFPLKSIRRGPQDSVITIEVVSVEPKAQPASLFQIPSGYKKSAGGSAPRTITEGQVKQLKQQMKDLPPEQRAAVEKLLRDNEASGVKVVPGDGKPIPVTRPPVAAPVKAEPAPARKITPEELNRLKEQMKDLPPEQRAAVERLIKQNEAQGAKTATPAKAKPAAAKPAAKPAGASSKPKAKTSTTAPATALAETPAK